MSKYTHQLRYQLRQTFEKNGGQRTFRKTQRRCKPWLRQEPANQSATYESQRESWNGRANQKAWFCVSGRQGQKRLWVITARKKNGGCSMMSKQEDRCSVHSVIIQPMLADYISIPLASLLKGPWTTLSCATIWMNIRNSAGHPLVPLL